MVHRGSIATHNLFLMTMEEEHMLTQNVGDSAPGWSELCSYMTRNFKFYDFNEDIKTINNRDPDSLMIVFIQMIVNYDQRMDHGPVESITSFSLLNPTQVWDHDIFCLKIKELARGRNVTVSEVPNTPEYDKRVGQFIWQEYLEEHLEVLKLKVYNKLLKMRTNLSISNALCYMYQGVKCISLAYYYNENNEITILDGSFRIRTPPQ